MLHNIIILIPLESHHRFERDFIKFIFMYDVPIYIYRNDFFFSTRIFCCLNIYSDDTYNAIYKPFEILCYDGF